jgi:hypothetical protein
MESSLRSLINPRRQSIVWIMITPRATIYHQKIQICFFSRPSNLSSDSSCLHLLRTGLDFVRRSLCPIEDPRIVSFSPLIPGIATVIDTSECMHACLCLARYLFCRAVMPMLSRMDSIEQSIPKKDPIASTWSRRWEVSSTLGDNQLYEWPSWTSTSVNRRTDEKHIYNNV